MKSNDAAWFWYGQMIEDIQIVFVKRTDWSIHFAYIEINNVGHLLAKRRLCREGEEVWIEEYPHEVRNAVILDKLCIDSVD